MAAYTGVLPKTLDKHSALIAVIVDEPEREKIIELTIGNTLIGPGLIPWEIGNTFSSMFKQNRFDLDEANKGLTTFSSIQLRFIETNFFNAISLAKQANIYAYDAYFLDCALRYSAPNITQRVSAKMQLGGT